MLLLVVNAAAVAAEVACVSGERLTADLLRRMMAARIQEEAFGTLDRATLKLLDGLARRYGSRTAPNLKIGTVLVRHYQGRRHTVTVEPKAKLKRKMGDRGGARSPPRRREECCLAPLFFLRGLARREPCQLLGCQILRLGGHRFGGRTVKGNALVMAKDGLAVGRRRRPLGPRHAVNPSRSRCSEARGSSTSRHFRGPTPCGSSRLLPGCRRSWRHQPLEEALANAYAYNSLSFISRVKAGYKDAFVGSYQKALAIHWGKEGPGHRDAASYIGGEQVAANGDLLAMCSHATPCPRSSSVPSTSRRESGSAVCRGRW